jgi:hypothetical protein
MVSKSKLHSFRNLVVVVSQFSTRRVRKVFLLQAVPAASHFFFPGFADKFDESSKE